MVPLLLAVDESGFIARPTGEPPGHDVHQQSPRGAHRAHRQRFPFLAHNVTLRYGLNIVYVFQVFPAILPLVHARVLTRFGNAALEVGNVAVDLVQVVQRLIELRADVLPDFLPGAKTFMHRFKDSPVLH